MSRADMSRAVSTYLIAADEDGHVAAAAESSESLVRAESAAQTASRIHIMRQLDKVTYYVTIMETVKPVPSTASTRSAADGMRSSRARSIVLTGSNSRMGRLGAKA